MMLNLPLVSIIMPLYNAEKYVAEAIQSVLAQTYTHWELIIVNDGSKDGSLEQTYKVLQNLIGLEREKIRIYSQENKGASAARNYGYYQSKGEYIKFFDADDILNKEMIEAQIRLAVHHQNSIISGKWGRFYHDDLNTFKLNPEECWQDMKPIDWICSSWKEGRSMTQPGIFLIPKSIIENAGVWNENLSLIDDFEYFTKTILSATKIVFSNQSILYYRSGLSNALSGQKSRIAVESAYLSLNLGTEYLLSVENSYITQLCCANMWQGFVYEFYYLQPDLAQKAELKVKELGGSDLKFPCGGVTKILINIFGWRFTLKLKIFFGSI